MNPKKLNIKNTSSINLVVVLDNIRSTYNVGAIFRTADALLVNKIYLCGITPTPNHPKISKTALGAEISVVWEKRKQCWRLLKELKQQNFFLIALEQDAQSKDIFKFSHLRYSKVALILGSETKGLSKNILRYVDLILEIPMAGIKESLNVAVAFGIAGYQLKYHLLRFE